jgi:hypothetical protein
LRSPGANTLMPREIRPKADPKSTLDVVLPRRLPEDRKTVVAGDAVIGVNGVGVTP